MTTSQVLLLYCALAGTAAGQELPAPTRIPPAALLDVSGNLIDTLIERPVQTVEPVQDVILDSYVFGMSRTTGKVSARLQNDRERASLTIILQGTSHSDTVGYQDPVKAYTHTVVNFEVHQPLTIDASGVRSYPLMAWARSCTRLTGVTNMHNSADSIVVGLGAFTFHEDKPQIEAIISQHAQQKVKASFGKELRPQIDKASRGLNDLLNALASFGVPLQPLRWSSTTKNLHGQAGLVGTAPMVAPPPLPSSVDLCLRLHQSVFSRMAQADLTGKTYSVLDLAGLRDKILKALNTGSKSKGSEFSPDKIGDFLKMFNLEPVSITFAKLDPVAVDLNADGFTITLRGSSFHQGGHDYPARNIQGRYRIETTPNSIALVRQGPVKVLPAGPYPIPDDTKSKNVEKVLVAGFNIFLPDRLLLPRIDIPGERPLMLVPSHATTNPGWLTLAWTRR